MYIYPQGEEGGERRHWQVGFSFTTSGGRPAGRQPMDGFRPGGGRLDLPIPNLPCKRNGTNADGRRRGGHQAHSRRGGAGRSGHAFSAALRQKNTSSSSSLLQVDDADR